MGRGNLAANTEGPQSLECARARGEDRRPEVGPPTNISLCGGFFPHNKIMVSGKDLAYLVNSQTNSVVQSWAKMWNPVCENFACKLKQRQ